MTYPLSMSNAPKHLLRHISFSAESNGHRILNTQSVNLIAVCWSCKDRQEMPVLIENILGVSDLSWNLSTCLVAILHAVIDILLQMYQPLLFAELTTVITLSFHWYIQDVLGGMCQTAGECSLGQTIPV